MANWIEQLKPGDKVIVYWPTTGHRIPIIKEVKSVGKKLISLVDYSQRFNKETGRETGGDWDYGSLKEATPEETNKIRLAIEKQEVVARLEKVRFDKLPLSVLKEIEGAIAAHQNKGASNEKSAS